MIALKILLQRRRIHGYSDFSREYMEHLGRMRLRGAPPAKGRYYKWLAGEVGLPRGQHCRVLEHMFPGWSADDLFQDADPSTVIQRDRAVVSSPAAQPAVEDPELATFLGSEIVDGGVALVYPVFQLAGGASKALTNAGVPRQLRYTKPSSPFSTDHRIDVPIVCAENDVEAVVLVHGMIQRHTAIRAEIASDHNVLPEAPARSFISFGFTSNDLTHMYRARADRPLFTIRDDPDSADYLEFVEVDGREFRSTDDRHIGLILRYRPDPENAPGRCWFFAAGVGPRGTTGAAWFLAHHWRLLHDQAGADDFCAVLNVDSYSDQSARLVHFATAGTTAAESAA